MIWAEVCTCGHSEGEHDHGTWCARCECAEFKDQNDLDKELNDAKT